jgi:hypothetical protein
MDDNDAGAAFLEKAKELLDKAAEDLDGRTRQRLDQIRMRTLHRLDDWLECLFDDIQRRM